MWVFNDCCSLSGCDLRLKLSKIFYSGILFYFSLFQSISSKIKQAPRLARMACTIWLSRHLGGQQFIFSVRKPGRWGAATQVGEWTVPNLIKSASFLVAACPCGCRYGAPSIFVKWHRATDFHAFYELSLFSMVGRRLYLVGVCPFSIDSIFPVSAPLSNSSLFCR